MTKCVVYARVSTVEQRDEGFSLPAQLKAIAEFCDRQDLQVEAKFVEAESASKSGRTEFGRMLDFLEKHPDARTIVVHKLDRLTRNFEDLAAVDRLSARIRCVVGDIPDSVQGTLLRDILAALARNYSLNLSHEVKKGMVEKVEQGGWVTRAPVGYVNDKATRTIVVDPLMAPLVKYAFERYASGLVALSDLLHELEAKGFRLGGSTKIHKSALHSMLGNPVYCGMVRYRGKGSTTEQIFPGLHEPIISVELFERVQAAFLPNRTNNGGSKRTYVLRDFLTCAECGCKITAGTHKGHAYYRCTHGKGKDSCSQRRYVREESMVDQVEAVLARIAVPDAIVQALVAEAEIADGARSAQVKKELDTIDRALSRNQQRRSALVDGMLDGIIDEGTYREKASELSHERTTLELRRREVENSTSTTFSQVEHVARLGAGASFAFKNGSQPQQREILATVLCNLTLAEGKIASYQYKRPFDVLEMDTSGAFLCSWSG